MCHLTDGATIHTCTVDVLGTKILELATTPAAIREYSMRAVAVILRHQWDEQQTCCGSRPDPYAWTSTAQALGYADAPRYV